jgi:hydrogenase expression/formation protein HypD
MLSEKAFSRAYDPAQVLAHIAKMQFPGHDAKHPVRLMEICGTHTMAIAKAGLRQALPKTVTLLSGPGCPVCVTPAGAIDEVLRIAKLPGVMIATYGDLIRVPGSTPGENLARCRALGADVRVVYSAMDAVALAKENPARQVVFLGVGFETTAPGTAACVLAAQNENVKNFSLLCLLKRTEPALRALLAQPDFCVDGFICPGHVATIVGADSFAFLPEEYRMPAVVSGFEAGDILAAVYMLCRQIEQGAPKLENEYTRAVRAQGNPAARAMVEQVFCPADDVWRGLGAIAQSGYALKPEYVAFDAVKQFDFAPENKENRTGCRCGEILRGALTPQQCPLFGRACLPENPVGPCMVSSEGACAAAYKYRSVEADG